MGHAQHAAQKSKDSTKVGAVLVSPDGAVLMAAFNGPPKGVQDYPERFERPAKYLYASHAEANLIAFAGRHGIRTQGCTVYTTHHPCSGCAKTLIQAGIREVVYGEGKTNMPSDEVWAACVMFDEAGVMSVPLSMAEWPPSDYRISRRKEMAMLIGLVAIVVLTSLASLINVFGMLRWAFR